MKQWVKYTLIAFVALLVLGAIFGKEETQNQTTATTEQNSDASTVVEPKPPVQVVKTDDNAQQKALEHFKTKEKQVKDAMWSHGILKLGVLDDGSKRDGFAEYACQVLKDDYKINEQVMVEVLDIAKLAKTNKEVVLGKANCQ